jgi:amidase
MSVFTVEQSGAFIETFLVGPTGSGVLDGLRFAVKDLVDVAGYRTGRGNPDWRAKAPKVAVHAVCVEQLLAAGATCVGKTITDELAYSLLGENHHYGTPLNPAAPERVPGGSSSGSASAVACGLADFAVGTDTGGSVRVPASNCGIWGWRPTYGFVSVAGVTPLAPSFDTVGILARSADILRRASMVLLSPDMARAVGTEPASIRRISEPWDWADAEVREALGPAVERLAKSFGCSVERTSLVELCEDASAGDSANWVRIYRTLVSAEAMCSHGTWILNERPALGPMTKSGFDIGRTLDRSKLGECIGMREHYAYQLRRSIRASELLLIPTAPTTAPMKGSSRDRNSDYYQRALALNAIAGTGRLPQISMPLSMASGAPIGLSIIGAYGEDAFLLAIADVVASMHHLA